MVVWDQLADEVVVVETAAIGLRLVVHSLSPHQRIPPAPDKTFNPSRPFFSSQIIAILAAILFPVFARAREKARQSSCLSNVKQITLAILQYTQDYDEMTPAVYRLYGSDGTTRVYWKRAVLPYAKNDQIYDCPSTSTKGTASTTSYDYFLNYYNSAWALARIVRSAEAIIIGDGKYYRCNPWTTPADSTTAGLVAPHNDGANLGFVDGHAKWYQYEEANTNVRLWDWDLE